MEPIKLEDHIREKLQDREIEPSHLAWAKLEKQLGESDSKRPFVWYAIAASFIGIISVASFVFTNEKSTTDIVNENTTEKIETESPSENSDNNHSLEQITSLPSETIVEETRTQEKEEKTAPKGNKIVQNQSIYTKESRSAIALTEVKKTQKTYEETETSAPFGGDENLENLKIEQVVAQVKAIQNKNTMVTNEELDALLKQAQQELQTQRILSNPKVDAMSLLEDIEFEVERSFRDKVFEALGENFNKIRTAVSNRNN